MLLDGKVPSINTKNINAHLVGFWTTSPSISFKFNYTNCGTMLQSCLPFLNIVSGLITFVQSPPQSNHISVGNQL